MIKQSQYVQHCGFQNATHTYLYDGWNLVQETIATTTSITTNRYVWGKDLSGTLQGAGGVGGLLAVIQGRDGSPSRPFFPLYDNNGNITAYVNDTGTIVAEYRYDPFGNTIAQSGTLADTFPHRFSTKYYDPETGLYYYGYRFYSPALMRWLNRDPIGENGGENLYGFVGNNPFIMVDALGMKPVYITIAYGAGVAVHPQYIQTIITAAKSHSSNRASTSGNTFCIRAMGVGSPENIGTLMNKGPTFLVVHGALYYTGRGGVPPALIGNIGDNRMTLGEAVKQAQNYVNIRYNALLPELQRKHNADLRKWKRHHSEGSGGDQNQPYPSPPNPMPTPPATGIEVDTADLEVRLHLQSGDHTPEALLAQSGGRGTLRVYSCFVGHMNEATIGTASIRRGMQHKGALPGYDWMPELRGAILSLVNGDLKDHTYAEGM